MSFQAVLEKNQTDAEVTEEEEVRNLISAVATAARKTLTSEDFNERLLIQKGYFLLNQWGFVPELEFNLYIRGPYSPKLADFYYMIERIEPNNTNVPSDIINNLSDIINKGIGYLEAYATLVMVIKQNPNEKENMDKVLEIVNRLKPTLTKEVKEAAKSLFNLQ